MRLPPAPVRRILLPVQVLIVVVLLAVFVVATVLAAAAAPFGSRLRPLRISAFALTYCTVEIAVIAGGGLVWLRRPHVGRRHLGSEESWVTANEVLLSWALDSILGAARLCFGFVVNLESAADPPSLLGPEPTLLLPRHAGPGDSFALLHLLMSRYRRRVLIVMKETLQLDPMLDLVLNRLGSCFLPPPGGGKKTALNGWPGPRPPCARARCSSSFPKGPTGPPNAAGGLSPSFAAGTSTVPPVPQC